MILLTSLEFRTYIVKILSLLYIYHFYCKRYSSHPFFSSLIFTLLYYIYDSLFMHVFIVHGLIVNLYIFFYFIIFYVLWFKCVMYYNLVFIVYFSNFFVDVHVSNMFIDSNIQKKLFFLFMLFLHSSEHCEFYFRDLY